MPTQTKHLIIDGNNIGRALGDIAMVWRQDRDAGQHAVVGFVRDWHDAMGWRVTTVFDGKGAALSVETPGDEPTFVVAYAPRGMTADSVIEQWVEKSRAPELCVVATRDRALAETVRALQAEVISPEDLISWVSRAREVTRRSINRASDSAW
ncbi:NYN domain-containing protein [Synoicihabitans lomoniglobus]|uniref:NYN domain-containing protein n=1 Tax=Synoicihabitans lomoniglobus TaxID=2909285 RepID=A0AAF0CRI8_9BACT|nr:NYN domain-containing protein [Opitutaceae bacterium LMO-M01]WED66709.1 NYN domain-containing protein [Opitutaceae bacterium LMO-M01]